MRSLSVLFQTRGRAVLGDPPSPQSDAVDLDLDRWLPDPQVRALHRRASRASADELWQAAGSVRLKDAPTLGRAVGWRIPGTSPDLRFRDLLRSYPFAVLAEGERWSISGLCGRLWTLRRDYPRLEGAAQFLEWDEPGTVRVVLANWVETDDRGGAALVSESRIRPVDRAAAVRLRALWMLVGHLQRLIGGEALRVAVGRAERS